MIHIGSICVSFFAGIPRFHKRIFSPRAALPSVRQVFICTKVLQKAHASDAQAWEADTSVQDQDLWWMLAVTNHSCVASGSQLFEGEPSKFGQFGAHALCCIPSLCYSRCCGNSFRSLRCSHWLWVQLNAIWESDQTAIFAVAFTKPTMWTFMSSTIQELAESRTSRPKG